MLRVKGLGKAFGGVKALTGLDLALGSGEIVGLIGPNGSGKTTTVNLLTGIYRASTGSVELDGKELTKRKPDVIAKAGLARTFQNLRLFKAQSVLDNVRIGQTILCKSLASHMNALGSGSDRALRREAEE